ncbi:MAG: competence protein ComFB [Methylomonas sp.]|jgi:hypothetical protein|nr:MAG: competence protein ComFB [Methylomonas sp.]
MFDITNYYEQLVTDHLWQLKENTTEPLTQSFLDDVACLALNSLPPCYVRNTIDKSAAISENDYQDMRNETSIAIEKAILKVKLHPHDERPA